LQARRAPSLAGKQELRVVFRYVAKGFTYSRHYLNGDMLESTG